MAAAAPALSDSTLGASGSDASSMSPEAPARSAAPPASNTEIAITGESPEFFSEYKIQVLRRDMNELTGRKDRVLDFGAGTGNSIPFFHSCNPGLSLTCADVSRP